MQTVQRDPKTLIPHPRNSRKHTAAQIEMLAEAMQTFGFHQPVVVDGQDFILIGHARTEAAIMAGLQTIPVVVRSDLTEAQARALIVADNRSRELGAGWDEAILGEELRALMAEGIDITVTGFDTPEPLAQKSKTADEDDVPEPPATPLTQPGDVWILGRHRLHCGDSTSPDLLAACMASKPVLLCSDPPYGIGYSPEWRDEAGIGSEGSAKGVVLNDHKADWREVWAGFTGAVAFVWHAGTRAHEVHESLVAAGFDVKAQIVWAKNRAAIGRGHYHHGHEPAFYAARKKAKPKWHGPAMSTFWEVGHNRFVTHHSTQKPVECMRRPILALSAPGDVVFEPFSGSGTTIIACEMVGRTCIAVELDLAYCDVAALRWARFTGQKARLMRAGVEVDLPDPAGHPGSEAGVVEIAE
jgi:DNA modification methylase